MRSLFFSLIAFYILTVPSVASEVLIRTDAAVGQGFLFENDNKCYAVTPRHVVETASKIELQTRFPRIYTFSQEHLFDVDLAVLSTQEKVALCESLDFTFADKLAAFLQIIDEGILKTQLDDGSVKQTKVDIVTVDNTEFLEIRPQDGDDNLQQGNSGSILYVANNPAGILLEVIGLKGVVYRSDALKPKLATYFADPSTAHKKEEGPQYILGVFSNRIAQDELIEFKFAGEANSPLEFHLPKVGGNFSYSFDIFDERDNNVWSRNNSIYSGNEYRFTFIPQNTQTYRLRLRGKSGYGELRGKLWPGE